MFAEKEKGRRAETDIRKGRRCIKGRKNNRKLCEIVVGHLEVLRSGGVGASCLMRCSVAAQQREQAARSRP